MMTGSYEFSAEQNKIIGKTGTRVYLWGILILVSAILMLLMAVVGLTGGIPAAIAIVYCIAALIPLFVGLSFIRAGKALKSVASTEGRDVELLLDAMSGLSTAFGIQLLMAVLWLCLIVVGILGAIAIPKFAETKSKAYTVVQQSDLRNLRNAQEAFFLDSSYYQRDVSRLTGFTPSQGVTITLSADSTWWSAVSTHTNTAGNGCAMFVGEKAPRPSTPGGTQATAEGEAVCDVAEGFSRGGTRGDGATKQQ